MKFVKVAIALAATISIWTLDARAQMRAHFINMGQAEAILLEMPKAAVMIDAGGECTCDDRDRKHLMEYLSQFFKERTDLNKTIHTLIVSHPHIDHTMLLMDVMQRFNVRNYIDGGDDGGSGIVPVFAARWYAMQKNIKYFPISDKDIGKNGFTNDALRALGTLDPAVDIKLLSGRRGCRNRNNDSLVVLARYKDSKFIFTGDAEAMEEDDDNCTPGLTHLLERYKGTNMLDVDVYKVGHHGSFNGTSEEWMQALSPKFSVISAGSFEQQGPGDFHAWQFGHPREAAVKIVEKFTSEKRTPSASVVTMDKVKQPHPNRRMRKAVYCTCWDGDIIIEAGVNAGALRVVQPDETN
jgi:competence protein ComEC